MRMTSKDGYTRTILPVPDADGLVVRCGYNPRALMVEVDSSDVVEMAVECENASSEFVIPDLDLVVIAA